MADWKLFVPKIAAIEGGYQESEHDRGNYLCPGQKWALRDFSCKCYTCVDGRPATLVGTNHGIAAPTLANHRKMDVSKSDMKQLTLAEAQSILRMNYWEENRLSELNSQSVAEIFCDGCINHGDERATKWMQSLLNEKFNENLAVDGICGSKTLAAINRQPEAMLFNAYRQKRLDWYQGQLSDDFNWSNVDGWEKRINNYFPEMPTGNETLPEPPTQFQQSADLAAAKIKAIPASIYSAQARKEAAPLVIVAILLFVAFVMAKNALNAQMVASTAV